MELASNLYPAIENGGLSISSIPKTIRILYLTYESPIRLAEGTAILGAGKIGAYSYIGRNFNFSSFEIGRYCSMASYIREVGDHDMGTFSTHPLFDARGSFFPGDRIFDTFVESRLARETEPHAPNPVTRIGHDVWIGEGVLLKAGITIGNGAVIGANSFVKKDVPPYAVVAGWPAVIKKFRFSDALIERFQKVAWWNYDLSPLAAEIDFKDATTSLDKIEEGVASGKIGLLRPDQWILTQQGSQAHLAQVMPAPEPPSPQR